ncbi:MAG: septal ring lytic transglycosylase RlpA family protein [Pseudomonadales bacterium]|jgi:rare lipoprotein A|nr:septal ring lytic transglycosylase RlpA family protein [Pseudomonadales bacterium]MCP5321942.1 septal ring lytic transglycosylase RlpA family protein [Pseudomonadales bacterium]
MSVTQRCGIESRARRRTYAGVVALVVMLAGCASQPGTSPGAPVAGGSDRPQQDGTPEFRADIMTIPDAVPRPEPVTSAGNKSPYTVLGTTYRVAPARPGYRERGFASWYGTKFHGQYTSNGEPYDVYTMTAAHKTLPIPCYVRVKNVENGRSIVVRVNDRGPFHEGRVLDLSYAAAYRLGYANKGTALVELEVLDPMAPEWVAKRREMAGDARLVASQPVARKTYLQAGAFRSMDGARSLQQTLASLLGHEVFIHRSADAASPWYRVRIGPLESTEALEDARRRLAAASIAGAQVVTE